jgi:hypothetical protein
MAQARRSSGFDSFEDPGINPGASPGDDSAEVEYEEGDGMVVDLSDTSDKIEYPVLPRGIYDAELVTMEYTQSQRSGNNMWACQVELTDPALLEKNNGKAPKLYHHLVFTEGGMPRVKQFLMRIKCDDDANLALLKGKFNAQTIADEGTLLGARMRVKVDIRRYQGSNRNNVKDILPPANKAGGEGFANL